MIFIKNLKCYAPMPKLLELGIYYSIDIICKHSFPSSSLLAGSVYKPQFLSFCVFVSPPGPW